ncbi:hypothetical protein BDV40DRAFT_264835 [Aspergillus tamarii]|uniref:Uncharacterized protein n=1 Tax=Aspergillus tamarii TaxID=41984 RepID=A0A5N6UVJ9_ASPTM|nr:hypothetical protein BDV40DRAFT_264835 [Aspergillus tamarii]
MEETMLPEAKIHNDLESTVKIVNAKVQQLRTTGLTRGDWDALKNGRLWLIWGDHDETTRTSKISVTVWRRTRARNAYREIQDASNHLFLAVALSVTPTSCGKTTFRPILDYLTSLSNYESFSFLLSSSAKAIFETTAVEQGFSGNHRYLDFMQKVFPQQELRQIQFAYSLVRRDNVPSFLEAMQEGIYSSRLWSEEEMQGGDTSGCLTIFIPTREEEDGSCNIRVDRNVLMRAIHRFGMTKLKLE